jgi:hypothetical protein
MNGSRASHLNHAGPYYNQRGGRESYYDNPRNRVGPRQHSDPTLSRYNPSNTQGVYPTPTYGQSRDTVNTGGSTGSTSDQWNHSTDPSSENSSIDRIQGTAYDQQQQAHREPIAEEGNYTYANGQASGYHPGYLDQHGPPPPPPKSGAAAPRSVIRLSESAGMPMGGSPMPLGASSGNTGRPSAPPKRKSWLKRTFSKNG